MPLRARLPQDREVLLRLARLRSALPWIGTFLFGVLVGVVSYAWVYVVEMQEFAWQQYNEGVADGRCDRDCAYTHGDPLGMVVTGRENDQTGDCICVKELGGPDWSRQ